MNTQLITLGQAFAHCAGTFSYWIGIVLSPVLGVLGYLGVVWYENKNNKDLQWLEVVVGIIAFFALMLCIFATPCEIAQNTTVDMAAHGQYIGY